MAAARRAKFDKTGGYLAFGSIPAGYATLVGPIARVTGLIFFNSLDQDVVVSLDGGTTDFVTLPPGINFVLNMRALGIEYNGTVSVKRLSGASTVGYISCGVLREE